MAGDVDPDLARAVVDAQAADSTAARLARKIITGGLGQPAEVSPSELGRLIIQRSIGEPSLITEAETATDPQALTDVNEHLREDLRQRHAGIDLRQADNGMPVQIRKETE